MRTSAYPLALALLLAPLAAGVQAAVVHGTNAPVAKSTAGTAVRWVPLENGLKSAETSKKYLFVSVYTDWCGYCRKLEATTYKAPPVIAELDKHFESVKLNAESDELVTWKGKKITARALTALWGVEGFPTLLFINRHGEIVGSFNSYVEPDMMVKLLTYISSGARERKVTFDAFLEGKS